jgi:uncharacterized protein (TIGR03663 family)
MSAKLWILLLLIAAGLAWLYRSGDLSKRPMHTDEAIQGMKTIEVLNTGHFQYDPHDYHGPLLHFSTRWLGKLQGWNSTNIIEGRLRFVTAVYGMALMLIPLLLADALGRGGSAIAALLMAASPMINFYSRYYIPEVPFVFCCGLFIAALWRWSQSKNTLWLIVAGAAIGAAHAAKETFVLNLAAMVAGYIVAEVLAGSFVGKPTGYSFSSRNTGSLRPWIIVPLVAALVSVAFYSNFFHDWKGVKDSVLTYENYLHRSGGAGHAKPWDYYIRLLFWDANVLNRWSEALIGGLAVVGALSALFNMQRPSHHRAFLIFLSVYAFALLAIYCVIPYKTPWSVLGVDHAFAMLGGVGAIAIFRMVPGAIPKAIAGGLLTVGLYNLCHQTSLAIDFQFTKPRYSVHELNPYVYSHTTEKIPELAKHIHDLAALYPDGKEMTVQVIDSENGWPLPWYLRDMHHVGYETTVPNNLRKAAVIVVDGDKLEEAQTEVAPRAEATEDPDTFVGPPAPVKPQPTYDADEPCSLRTHSSTILNVLVQHDLMERYKVSQKKKKP